MKHRFVSTLPGAMIAVGGWIGLCYLLGIYFQEFSRYSKGYGSLGVALAFSIWLYWTGFVILIGAQFNSELLQETEGALRKTTRGRVIREFPSEIGTNKGDQYYTDSERLCR